MTGVDPETGFYDTDDESGAYRKGVIDARNHRTPRVDRADTSPIAVAYRHGYDTGDAA